jgi:hypothetical protein
LSTTTTTSITLDFHLNKYLRQKKAFKTPNKKGLMYLKKNIISHDIKEIFFSIISTLTMLSIAKKR